MLFCGLGVQDAVGVMCVQRRDAGLGARRIDAPVRRPEGALRGVHGGIADVDAYAGRHLDRFPVNEDIEMRVDMVIEELVRYRLKTGSHDPIERVRWRRPWHSAARRLGRGFRLLNLGRAAARDERYDEQRERAREPAGKRSPSHHRSMIRAPLAPRTVSRHPRPWVTISLRHSAPGWPRPPPRRGRRRPRGGKKKRWNSVLLRV